MIDFAELSTALGTFAGLITTFGGIGTWLYRRQNKRLKEAEAKLAEVQVEKAKMETKADDWHIWKEQADALTELNKELMSRNSDLIRANAEKEDRHQQDIKDWEERFTNQTNVLRATNREYNQFVKDAGEREKSHLKQIDELERRCDYLELWQCHREHPSVACDPEEGCSRRKPQQLIPLKFVAKNILKPLKPISLCQAQSNAEAGETM